MRVLVIGATGWIGEAIGDAFVAADDAVAGLARTEKAAQRLASKGVTPIHGDLTDSASLAAAARTSDATIYAAAAPADTTRDAITALLTTLAGSGKPLVYISGSSRYGQISESGPVDEELFIRRLATSAMDGTPERMIHDGRADVRGVIVVGAGILYGRGGGSTPTFWLNDARARAAAWYIGEGTQRWSAGHVDDLAALVVRAVAVAPSGGVFNAVAEAIPLRAAAEGVALAAGASSGAMSVPEATARDAWGASWSGMLAKNLWLSSARAATILGWQPAARPFLDDLVDASYHTMRQ